MKRLAAVLEKIGCTHVPEALTPQIFIEEVRTALLVAMALNSMNLNAFCKLVSESVDSFIEKVNQSHYSYFPTDMYTFIIHAMNVDLEERMLLCDIGGITGDIELALQGELYENLMVSLYEKIVPEIINQELVKVA